MMATPAEKPLLHIEDLWVRFHTRTRIVEAVRGLSFSMGREKVGIVGESGSGKTLTGRAILRLIRPPGSMTAQRLEFNGENLLAADERRMRAIRGRQIAMVMQDPKFSLNPVMTVGKQIAEAYRIHNQVNWTTARDHALTMLDAVRIRDPHRVYDTYPHQLSGGMGQRVMIAMMLIPNPQLLIADEPTSALDVSVRWQVLAIMDKLVKERGMGLLLVSHDLNLVAAFCDRVIIMYAGQIVETCPAQALSEARHPYTRGLLASLPRIKQKVEFLPVLPRQDSWATQLGIHAHGC